MKINVIFITDKKGIDLARFSIASFVRSQTDNCAITLYCDGFALDENDPVQRYATKAGARFTTKPISSDPFKSQKTLGHISVTTFSKFTAAMDASRDFDRVLYSDTDILYFDALPLRSLDFRGFPIAAAYDVAETSGVTDPTFVANCAANNVSPNYFNAGLIYLDTSNFEFDGFEKRYVEKATEHQRSCLYKCDCKTGDQCAWNLVFEDKWMRLPQTWNVQASMRFTESWKTAAVRHYTGAIKFLPTKPWRSDTRETAYLRSLAAELGVRLPQTSIPGNGIYFLNGLRWRRSAKVLNRAADELTVRINNQCAAVT